nr:transcription repressor OFP13-like [Ipomoea batatas]
MKLIPFLSKSSESTWPWQCGVSSPKTLSFRADDAVFAADHYSSSSPDDDSVEKESVAMAVESTDPFLDFRRSMEEMVAAHHNHGREDKIEEVLDWEFLEELLTSILLPLLCLSALPLVPLVHVCLFLRKLRIEIERFCRHP